MRLLLDTNILIDYYAQRCPFFKDTVMLRTAALFGDIELWAAALSFADVEYILRKAIPVSELRLMMRHSLDFMKVAAPTSADVSEALESDWPDLEDCLISRCAERVRAERIITRDVKGFQASTILAQTPTEFFAWLEDEKGIVYDDIAL